MYREAAKNIIRYFGTIDLDQIGRLSLYDYDLIMEALSDKLEDKNMELHFGAYLGAIAGEHDAKGKPHYPTFDSFYKHKTVKQDRLEKLKEHMRKKHKQNE